MRESLLGPESRARAARVELWLVRVPSVPASLGPGRDQYNTPGSTLRHHHRGHTDERLRDTHTRLTHGVAFYQNVGTRSNYIFKLSGKTIKKSNNSKNLSFNWRTGYKSSDFQISSSISRISNILCSFDGDHQDLPLLHGCSDTNKLFSQIKSVIIFK